MSKNYFSHSTKILGQYRRNIPLKYGVTAKIC